MRDQKESLSGLLFLLLGGGAVVVAAGYPVGTAGHMGAGYFPILVGGLLALIGLVKLVRAFSGAGGEATRIGGWHWRALVLVPVAVTCFGVLLLRAGLLPAIAVLVAVACLAGRRFRPLEALAIFAAVSVVAGLLWVEGLGFPMESLMLIGS